MSPVRNDRAPPHVLVCDTLKVYKIDRLARSLMYLLPILDTIQKVGAPFQSLTEPVDTSASAGRMMTHMLGAFAEFERGIIRERSMPGRPKR